MEKEHLKKEAINEELSFLMPIIKNKTNSNLAIEESLRQSLKKTYDSGFFDGQEDVLKLLHPQLKAN